MGDLGFDIRDGNRDILVPFRHACGGFYWSGPRRVVRGKEKRGGSQSGLGGSGGDAVCNNPEIRSFRDDDLLFCPCLVVRLRFIDEN